MKIFENDLFNRMIAIPLLILISSCSGQDSAKQDIYNSGGIEGDIPSIEKDVGTVEAEGINCSAFKNPKESPRDILGVTYGMSAEDAFARIACANPAFKVKFSTTQGFETEKLRDGSLPRKSIEANAGLERALVYLMGLPGAEKVIAVEREVEFGDESEPPFETIVSRLKQKYGESSGSTASSNSLHNWISYSPDGQKIGTDNSLYSDCTNYQSTSASISINSGCGLTIFYTVRAKSDNAGLAKSFKVRVVEQRNAMDAITSFNEAAQLQAAEGRQQELDRAKQDVERAGQKNSSLPSL